MTKEELKIKERKLSNIIKFNERIVEHSKSPHERDMARYRINLIKKKLFEMREDIYGRKK